jgi:P27 family predicted phage terminase small subunit
LGRRGPAPEPTNLRIIKGEKRYRINRDEPVPRNAPPERPAWLSKPAVAEWDRIMPDLARMGTAKAVDATALGAYCEAVALLAVLSDLVARTGPLVVGRDGLAHKNPAVSLRRDASVEVRMWAREFGFTPSARQPLRIEHSTAGLSGERLLS